jgi:hypothetical protein
VPNKTFVSERFIALHMMLVRITPDAPTRDPAIISTVLLMTKPVAAAAKPEYEFKRAITTGMSAPPIDSVRSTPKTPDSPTRSQYKAMLSGSRTTITPSTNAATAALHFRASMPGNRSFLTSNTPPIMIPVTATSKETAPKP